MSVRRSQTFQACLAIHGTTTDNIEPLAHGMMDTLACKVNAKDLSKCVLSCKKSVVNEIEKTVITEWRKKPKRQTQVMRTC